MDVNRRTRIRLGAVGFLASASALLVVAAPSVVSAQAFRTNAGFTTNNLPANDDDFTSTVQSLGFTANFFGANGGSSTGVYVSNNGYVTFDYGQGDYTPEGLTGAVTQPIIAPFFADVDTRATNSALTTWGTSTVDGRNAFGVDWNGVGYYDTENDKSNIFQLVMIDRSDTGVGNFDFEFNYNQVQWETGEADGGRDGLGGTCATAGYSNGGTGAANVSQELPGSGTCGSFLGGGPNSLSANSLNSNQAGRYLFQVRNGQVLPPPVTTTPEPNSLALLGTGLIGLVPLIRRRRSNG